MVVSKLGQLCNPSLLPIETNPVQLRVLAPLLFHLYFLAAGLISAALFHPPLLLGLTLLWAGLGWWFERRFTRA